MRLRALFVIFVVAASILYIASPTSAQVGATTPASEAGASDGAPGNEAGVSDAAAPESGLPPSPEEADFAKSRAEAATAVALASAGYETAEKNLVALKKLKVEYAIKEKESQGLGGADAGADAGALAAARKAALSVEIAGLMKDATSLYPAFDVLNADPNVAFGNAIKDLEQQLTVKRAAVDSANARTKVVEDEIEKLKITSGSLRARLRAARNARCRTAYCFGSDGTEYAFEPMLELPIGTSFAIGEGALARFSNGSDFSVQFTAGLRFWMLHDYVSLSIYFAKPIYTGNDTITVPGSSVAHSASSIRRLGPSFGLGLAGDLMFLGVGFDQLRNGNGQGRDPAYEPNQVLSRAVTISVGIAPFAAIRNVAGAVSK